MTTISGRMTCLGCGSPGFHKETCRSWPGKNRKPAMPEKDQPEDIRRDEGGWISGPSANPMNAPTVCPQCECPHVTWSGGSPPHGPDHWVCDYCGHAWTTDPVLPRPGEDS